MEAYFHRYNLWRTSSQPEIHSCSRNDLHLPALPDRYAHKHTVHLFACTPRRWPPSPSSPFTPSHLCLAHSAADFSAAQWDTARRGSALRAICGLTNKVQITRDPRLQPLSVAKNTAAAAAQDTVRHRPAPQANITELWHMDSCCQATFLFFFFFLFNKHLTRLAVPWQKSQIMDVTQWRHGIDCLRFTLF